MRIGLDIDNVVTNFDKKILEEFYKEDKNKRNKGLVNPKGSWIKNMFDWSNDEIENFFNDNMQEFTKVLEPREDALDEILCESINNRIKKYKDLSVMNKINIKEILGDDNNNQINALVIEKKDIEKKIIQKDNIYQGMYEDLKTGIIDYEEYRLFKENFKNEKNNLSARLEIVNKQLNELENAEVNFEEAGKIYKKYNSIKEVTREIINEFVERIYVGEYDKESKSRDIKIKWRYQF